jgi:hypothetical protein
MKEAGVALWVALAGSMAAAVAVEPPEPPTQPGAVEALVATVEVERTLLKEDQARHERVALERTEAAARVNELYRGLDAALRRDDTQAASAVEELFSTIEEAERERSEILSRERALVERIRDRLRRIALLEEQVAAVQQRAQESAGPLTGRWEVVLLPVNQRGTFLLRQVGTLVSGTYALEGGWSGSLQGTLVNRKVFLERIDSKLGRSGQFEGVLSPDGSRIRGSWTTLELAGGAPSEGQWAATRRSGGS